MLRLQKLTLVALVCVAPAWAQSGHSSAPAPSELPEYKLEPIAIPNIVYPPQAREQKIEGEVHANLVVSETGDVRDVRVFNGNPLLTEAVVQTVSKWKFKPVMKGGNAITVLATANCEFVVGDDNQARNGVVPELGSARERPQRLRVSGGVSSGLIAYKVPPVYPADALRAHIQGIVTLQAVISHGRITDLHLISGPRELAPAAIAAVQQWRYKPYMFMGDEVEFETQIQVSFTLTH